MIERFEGASGKSKAIDSILGIANLCGNQMLAEEIYDAWSLCEYDEGETIIQQGDYGEDVYFILSGIIEISVAGKIKMIRRNAPVHIGEMSAIDPKHPRTATIKVISKKMVAGVLTGDSFQKLLSNYPKFNERVRSDVEDRMRRWMDPGTEQASSGVFSFFQLGGIALLASVIFGALAFYLLSTNLAVVALIALTFSTGCFFLAWISRAAVLWFLFSTSAMTTLSSAVPGLKLSGNIDIGWLQLDGGYGGEPDVLSISAMLGVTVLLLFAAYKVSFQK